MAHVLLNESRVILTALANKLFVLLGFNAKHGPYTCHRNIAMNMFPLRTIGIA